METRVTGPAPPIIYAPGQTVPVAPIPTTPEILREFAAGSSGFLTLLSDLAVVTPPRRNFHDVTLGERNNSKIS